ncbi:hypothetical protein F5Y18DRAFT_63472 [Xylariaceae sp. FL1019]|nr:hypothetical protein F5Y18DRAFT_63472 [Xylariaceae sp. FL1019]
MNEANLYLRRLNFAALLLTAANQSLISPASSFAWHSSDLCTYIHTVTHSRHGMKRMYRIDTLTVGYPTHGRRHLILRGTWALINQ